MNPYSTTTGEQGIDIDEPGGWQTEIMDLIQEKPDLRTIHWFWEDKGNVGKTSLCNYLVIKHGALMLTTSKSNDMYHMISKFPDKNKLFVVDCPRSQHINYEVIEQIKNGLVFSGKYNGIQLIFNCPHVIVFANIPPDKSTMSIDRWNVRFIERDDLTWLGAAPRSPETDQRLRKSTKNLI
jgi:hypothetical protein